MIGIVYAIAIVTATLFSGVKCAIEEQHQITEAKKRRAEGANKYNLYTDRKGATRDLTTGQLRRVDYIGCESEGEDQYIRDIYGNPIRNLSMERRMQRRNEAISDDRRTVYLWSEGTTSRMAGVNGNPYYSGQQYKDIQTGKIYVCRSLMFPKEISENYGGGKFYMDILNGLLVREADSQIYDRELGNYKYSRELNKKFIEYFNDLQKKGGYHPLARHKIVSGWEQEESELDKELRMEQFYCNQDECRDIPSGRIQI